ncbi:Ribophorin I, partial [Tricharina praecox]|uniref:Ribophorin I n=1 Tax=Tricharina praecox TaxID=43433 RepID=UPI00221EF462
HPCLPSFAPAPVFRNINLLRSIDLTKPYSKEGQTEYYMPFAADEVTKVSFFEAGDKKAPFGEFKVDEVEFDPQSPTQYYRILLTEPLAPGNQITLQVAIGKTTVVEPIPAEIEQVEKQFLQWTGTQYVASAYVTDKQKTKLKLPNNEAPEFTKLTAKSDGTSDPTKVGSAFTYGPYEDVKPSSGAGKTVKIRYEYTHPVIVMEKLTRDIEVSHWGGNIAFEEKYVMTNAAAKLKNQFSRVKWAAASYYGPPTSAIKALTYNLKVGSIGPYFTDEIGNVSTSRFRSNMRESHLEIKPREFVRAKPNGEDFVLRVPLLEGPKEPVVYGDVEIRVILPEGATDVKYSSPIPIIGEEHFLHKTFMDTIGRTAFKLRFSNVVDEQHHKELIVTYHLPKTAGFRKPFVIFTALSTVFVFSWIVSKIDVRIENRGPLPGVIFKAYHLSF